MYILSWACCIPLSCAFSYRTDTSSWRSWFTLFGCRYDRDFWDIFLLSSWIKLNSLSISKEWLSFDRDISSFLSSFFNNYNEIKKISFIKYQNEIFFTYLVLIFLNFILRSSIASVSYSYFYFYKVPLTVYDSFIPSLSSVWTDFAFDSSIKWCYI